MSEVTNGISITYEEVLTNHNERGYDHTQARQPYVYRLEKLYLDLANRHKEKQK